MLAAFSTQPTHSLAHPRPQMHISIITGASRGMGEPMAVQLAQAGHKVLGISRGSSAVLAGMPNAEQWQADLADAVPVAQRLQGWIGAFDASQVQSITLINNAALLTSPGPAHEVGAAQAAATLRVGLESVVVLSNAFLAATRQWACSKRLLNISSGNGRRALQGSAVYSALKAGMDHYTRVLALDEAEFGNLGAKVCSLAPGVIDTDMQVQLRNADPSKFKAHAQFVAYKAEGHLLSPQAAATRVLAYLNRADFGSNPVADVREA